MKAGNQKVAKTILLLVFGLAFAPQAYGAAKKRSKKIVKQTRAFNNVSCKGFDSVAKSINEKIHDRYALIRKRITVFRSDSLSELEAVIKTSSQKHTSKELHDQFLAIDFSDLSDMQSQVVDLDVMILFLRESLGAKSKTWKNTKKVSV